MNGRGQWMAKSAPKASLVVCFPAEDQNGTQNETLGPSGAAAREGGGNVRYQTLVATEGAECHCPPSSVLEVWGARMLSLGSLSPRKIRPTYERGFARVPSRSP